MKKILIYRKTQNTNVKYKLLDFIKSHSSTLLLNVLFWTAFLTQCLLIQSGNNLLNKEEYIIMMDYFSLKNSYFFVTSITVTTVLIIMILSTIFAFNIFGTIVIYSLPVICGFIFAAISAIALNSDTTTDIILSQVVFSLFFSVILFVINNHFLKSQQLSFLLRNEYNDTDNRTILKASLKKYIVFAVISYIITAVLIILFYSIIRIII